MIYKVICNIEWIRDVPDPLWGIVIVVSTGWSLKHFVDRGILYYKRKGTGIAVTLLKHFLPKISSKL